MIYEPTASDLVQKPEIWFGENVGEVVGCLSHITIDGASHVCDAKVAVQCSDNTKPYKSIGIYANLEGESDEILIACESIQNGDYKNVTLVELPVTLDGAVEDFGIQEGGGGGGGDVPENMMTVDTDQQVSGVKFWNLQSYIGGGTVEEPMEGDRILDTSLSLGNSVNNPIAIDTLEQYYSPKDGWYDRNSEHLQISSSGVTLGGSNASWGQIINAARTESRFDHATVNEVEGVVYIDFNQVKPNSEVEIGLYCLLRTDSNGYFESVCANGDVLDISVAIRGNGDMRRMSGIVDNEFGITFEPPITPVDGQEIFIHWTRYAG